MIDAPRAAQLASRQTHLGADSWQRSEFTLEDQDALQLLNTPLPTWAMYQFDLADESAATSMLTVQLSDTPGLLPQQLYVGVSDYAELRWEWHSIAAPQATATIPLPIGTLLSASGNLYIVVLCLNDSALVDYVAIDYDIVAPPPVDLVATDGTRSDGVLLTWTDPAVTYAGDPSFAYDHIAIERTMHLTDKWIEYGRVPVGQTSYLDISAPDYGDAQVIYYRVRTVRDSQVGPPGSPDTGWRNAFPVVVVTPQYGPSIHAPGKYEVSAAGSSDPDGGALQYEWDFLGDGNWYSSGAVNSASYDYDGSPNGINVGAKLRVTDDEGNATIKDLYVNVYGEVRRWEVQGNAVYSDAALDGAGNSYLDYSLPAGGTVVAKFDPQCALLWARSYDASFAHIAAAPDGSFYLYDDDRVARFSAEGDLQWARTAAPGLRAYEAKADASARLWLLCGMDVGIVDELQLLCIAADGSVVFRKRFDDPGGGHLTVAQDRGGITFDADGNAYLAATLVEAVNHAVVLKLAPDGAYLWQEQLVTPSWDSAAVDICSADKLSVLTSEGSGVHGFVQLDFNGSLNGSWETSDLGTPRRMYQAINGRPVIEVNGGFMTTKLSWNGFRELWGWTNLSTDSQLIGESSGERFVFATPLTTTWEVAFGGISAASYSVEETALAVESLTQDLAPLTITESAPPGVTEGSGQTVCRFVEESFGEPGGGPG
jgi:hypothetical protein